MFLLSEARDPLGLGPPGDKGKVLSTPFLARAVEVPEVPPVPSSELASLQGIILIQCWPTTPCSLDLLMRLATFLNEKKTTTKLSKILYR